MREKWACADERKSALAVRRVRRDIFSDGIRLKVLVRVEKDGMKLESKVWMDFVAAEVDV